MKIETLAINYSKPNKAIVAYVPRKPGVKIDIIRNMTVETILATVDLLRDAQQSITVADKTTLEEFELLVRKVTPLRSFRYKLKNLFSKKQPQTTPAVAANVTPLKKK